MRLHPVIPMVVRTLTAPATIGGIDLPAGVTVGPSILLAHARPDNHAAPGVFRPERFIEGSPAPNTWIPFGGGVRRCIGAGFSLMEGVVVLRELLTAYIVESLAEDRPRSATSPACRGTGPGSGSPPAEPPAAGETPRAPAPCPRATIAPCEHHPVPA